MILFPGHPHRVIENSSSILHLTGLHFNFGQEQGGDHPIRSFLQTKLELLVAFAPIFFIPKSLSQAEAKKVVVRTGFQFRPKRELRRLMEKSSGISRDFQADHG